MRENSADEATPEIRDVADGVDGDGEEDVKEEGLANVVADDVVKVEAEPDDGWMIPERRRRRNKLSLLLRPRLSESSFGVPEEVFPPEPSLPLSRVELDRAEEESMKMRLPPGDSRRCGDSGK